MTGTLEAYNRLIEDGVFTEEQAGAIVDMTYDASPRQLDREAAHARLTDAGLTERQAWALIGVTEDYYAGEYDVS